MKELRLTYEDPEWKNLERAKIHSKLTWKEFIQKTAQLYWKEELKKRHGDLKIN